MGAGDLGSGTPWPPAGASLSTRAVRLRSSSSRRLGRPRRDEGDNGRILEPEAGRRGPGGPGPGPDSRLQTGILGFDHLTLGGLPRGRATLVVGPAGSGKTVFAGQFLCEGAERGEPAVFVTFEEPAVDLRTNLAGLGWDIRAWEEAGLWRFVDASPVAGEGGWTFDPSAGLKTLVAQVGEAVDRTAASRIVLDSLNVMLAALGDPDRARG